MLVELGFLQRLLNQELLNLETEALAKANLCELEKHSIK